MVNNIDNKILKTTFKKNTNFVCVILLLHVFFTWAHQNTRYYYYYFFLEKRVLKLIQRDSGMRVLKAKYTFLSAFVWTEIYKEPTSYDIPCHVAKRVLI